MIEQVSKETFITRFDEIGRGNTFTVAARKALFEYIEEMESDCGDTINFDPIALCCDWSEYNDAIDWAKDYFTDDSFSQQFGGQCIQDSEDQENTILERLSEDTQVIKFNSGILVAAF